MTAYYILDRSGENAAHVESSGFSLFDLKAQVQVIKIYISYSAALMNLILQDKVMSGP